MAKCAVVLRKLTTETFVSAVIQESKDKAIDNMDHYLRSEAESHIRNFCRQFPEFKTEMFSVQIVEMQ
jgi:hypothetical protein